MICNKTFKKIMGICVLLVMLATAIPLLAFADDGGWTEGSSLSYSSLSASTSSSVKHTGKAERKVISGTTNKRSHGWTTWVGVYHYTRARLEWPLSGRVQTDSGRKWGISGTEAISPWYAFRPGDGGFPTAKTYYGH